MYDGAESTNEIGLPRSFRTSWTDAFRFRCGKLRNTIRDRSRGNPPRFLRTERTRTGRDSTNSRAQAAPCVRLRRRQSATRRPELAPTTPGIQGSDTNHALEPGSLPQSLRRAACLGYSTCHCSVPGFRFAACAGPMLTHFHICSHSVTALMRVIERHCRRIPNCDSPSSPFIGIGGNSPFDVDGPRKVFLRGT